MKISGKEGFLFKVIKWFFDNFLLSKNPNTEQTVRRVKLLQYMKEYKHDSSYRKGDPDGFLRWPSHHDLR